MPVIDAHVHLYPDEVNRDPAGWAARAGEAHWARLCTRTRKDGRGVQEFPSVEELLSTMDSAGVTGAVLLGWYWEHPDHARWHNRFYAECVRQHPGRLRAFASVHPRWSEEELRAELDWAKSAGFSGIGELSPHSQGVDVNSAAWGTLLQVAAEFDLPINLHVTEPDGRGYPGRIDTPLPELVAMLRDHPENVFILAHWGGKLPLRLEHSREMAHLRNVFFDTAASPLIYPPAIVKEMVSAAGPGRIIWGTDYPLRLYPDRGYSAEMAAHLAEMRAELSGLPALDDILGGNAARLLRLEAWSEG